MPLFLVVLIAALVSALPAHAGFLAPVVGAFLGLGTVGTAILQVGLGVGASLIARARQPKQKKQGPGALSLDVPTQGDATTQTIILGRRAVVGHRTCPEYSRANGLEWLTIVRDLADAPVNRLVAIWIGNDRIEMPATFPAWSDPSVFHDLGGKFAGKARLRFHDGTQTQADNFMLWAYAGHADRPWSADMVLRGVPYVVVELKRDQELFPGQPDLLFEVEGMRLYDPRTGQMVSSDNLALLTYNVLRGIQMPDGSIYGGQLADEDLPLSSWGPGISEAAAQGWRGGLEVNVGPEDMGGDHPYEVADHLLQGCAGQIAESGGIWRVRIGGPGLPVSTITEGDMIVTESQIFTPHLSPREVYNGISAQYPEPAERWEPKAMPLMLDGAYVAADGGRNVTSMTYHAVSDSQRAQQLTQMALDDNRRQRIHEVSAPSDYTSIELLDTLRLNIPADGYINKLVEVQAVWRDPITLNQRLLAREVDPSDYTPPSVQPLPTVPVITTPLAPQSLPGWAVQPVIVQDDAGRSRRSCVRIFWTPLPAEGIEWELRSLGATELAGEGTTQEVEKGQKLITSGLINAAQMQIRARAVLRNRARAWTAWTTFEVPNIGLGTLDLRMTEIQQEVRQDLQDRWDWMDETGDVLRRVDDEIAAIRDGAADGQFGALLARDELRREVALEIGNQRASFEEQIDVIATEQLSAAIRTSTLRAQFNATTALVREEMIALAGPDSALAGRIDTVEVALNGAEGSTTQGLIARVDTIDGQLASTGEAITRVRALTDRGLAEGLIRATAESSPSGVQATVGMRVEATANGASKSAAFFMRAFANGRSDVLFAADRLAIATGQDANGPIGALVPFVVDGADVFMQNAIVRTLSIGDNQVTVAAAQTLSNSIQGNDGWQLANSLSYTLPYAGAVTIEWNASQGYDNLNRQPIGFRLVIDGVVMWSVGGGGQRIETDFLSMAWKFNLSAGAHTIAVEWFGAFSVTLYSRTLIIDGAMR